MNNQKRLIYDLKNFVEKVFLSGLKKTDGPCIEWSRFVQFLNSQSINYQQMHQYVESINNNSTTTFEKREVPLFKKKKEEGQLQIPETSFNPSKTFGGERAKMMLNKGEMDDFGEQKRDTGSYNNIGMGGRVSPQTILPGLQRLCKIFVQNQQKMQNLFNNASKSPIKRYG